MGFGGSVSAMITTLKNNRRDKVNLFDTLKSNSTVKKSNNLYFEKKASKKQLLKIREKIQRENRIQNVFTVIVISIVSAVMLYLCFF